MNSRAKGARGERAAAAYINTVLPDGYVAERAARSGVRGGEDVLIYATGGISRRMLPITVEVKHRREMGLRTKALDRACEQAARSGRTWGLLWRGHREGPTKWKFTVGDSVKHRCTLDTDESIRVWFKDAIEYVEGVQNGNES